MKCLREAVQQKLNIIHALETTAEAAKRGSESTKDLIAKQGKVKYLGPQSLGHIDPGAEVMSLIFETLVTTAKHALRTIPPNYP